MNPGRTTLRGFALTTALFTAGCTAVPTPGVTPLDRTASEQEESLVPAGYGTLIQDEFTLTLFSGDLRVKVTPLEESVIRLAAPDTYERLRGLAASHRPTLERRSGVEGLRLFLVSFFTRSPSIRFEPDDVQLLNRGVRFRHLGYEGVSPGFGSQRLTQEVPMLAVYAFAPEVDLEIDLAMEYQGVQNAGWSAIVTRLREERGRVRARAGGY